MKNANYVIPAWLFERVDVLCEDKSVASVVLAYQSGRDGKCYLTQRRIGEMCGLNRKQVNLSLARLTCVDGVRKSGRGEVRGMNRYRMPLVTKFRSRVGGRVLTCYQISLAKDTAGWWMKEEWHGRSGLGDFRTRVHGLSERRRKRLNKKLVAFPGERRA